MNGFLAFGICIILNRQKNFCRVDTVPVLYDSVQLTGSRVVDTAQQPKLSKDSLDAPVRYKARDSIVLVVPDKRLYLYGNAIVKYKTVNLAGGRMNFSQSPGILEATTANDSSGKPFGRPVLKDGEQSFDSDTLRYNFNTQRAKIYHTRSRYGEGYIHSQQTKREADNTFFDISRDLHCWQMSINLIPFGAYRQFSITISPKSGLLRDMRINRTVLYR